MACQRHLLAQLAQKLAITAAESLVFAAGAHQHSKYLVLDDQGCNNQRTQAPAGEPLRKRKRHLQHVRLIDQSPSDAPGQSILVYGHDQPLRQAECVGESSSGGAHGADLKRLRNRVVQQEASEIDWQILLETTQHDLKDALQI